MLTVDLLSAHSVPDTLPCNPCSSVKTVDGTMSQMGKTESQKG